ncbi:MAG: UDP-N-acetylmuramate dehydrogenase, partial [Pseudomonadota bacterium]
SWRTGGSAEYFFEPVDSDDLTTVLMHFSDYPITWLGLGSNVLVRDGGISGLVISTTKGLNQLSWQDSHVLRVDCGVPCAKIAKESVKRGFTGAEFLAGIPGTIGGALAMNAGAFGGETWELVNSARVINRAGNKTEIMPGDYATGYRHVALPNDHWFIEATLLFERTANAEASSELAGQARIRELLSERASTQPTGVASCGSVFKNPSKDHAGRLIEAAGLKGFSIGGCSVSLKHANFIENQDGANAEEIEQLIKHVQKIVLEQFGVLLEPEVRIIGNPSHEVAQ